MIGAAIRLGLAVLLVIGAGLSTRADPPDLLRAGSEAIQLKSDARNPNPIVNAADDAN